MEHFDPFFLLAYRTWSELFADRQMMNNIAMVVGILALLLLLRKLNKILVFFGIIIVIAFWWIYKNPGALEDYAGYDDNYTQPGSGKF